MAHSRGPTLTDAPDGLCDAWHSGNDENSWPPLISAPVLIGLLLSAISDPDGVYVVFAVDPAGTCTLQDREGRISIIQPTTGNLYDVRELGELCRHDTLAR